MWGINLRDLFAVAIYLVVHPVTQS